MIEKEYYQNGKIKYELHLKDNVGHRLDGPYYTYYNIDGNIEILAYMIDGRYSNKDGPAYINYRYSLFEYWLNGEQYHEYYIINNWIDYCEIAEKLIIYK